MATSIAKTDRLSCCIAPEHKRLLEQAAARRGMNVTDYVVSTSLQVAREELLAEEHIRLSAEDWDKLLAILEHPPAATPIWRRRWRDSERSPTLPVSEMRELDETPITNVDFKKEESICLRI